MSGNFSSSIRVHSTSSTSARLSLPPTRYTGPIRAYFMTPILAMISRNSGFSTKQNQLFYLFIHRKVSLLRFALNVVQFGFGIWGEGEHHNHFHEVCQSLRVHVDPEGKHNNLFKYSYDVRQTLYYTFFLKGPYMTRSLGSFACRLYFSAM